MMLPDLRGHFSRFLSAAPERIHAAAHSHHYWPDVTLAAQVACWEDAAELADRKWQRIFEEIIPAVQTGVATHLGLPDPNTVAFAPNTHEFVRRLLSSLPLESAPPRVLSSDSEFHSFSRQIARLEEDELLEVERIPVAPHGTFLERFATAAAGGGHALIFTSHVFFDSGFALDDLETLTGVVPDPATMIVVDGYHAFLARPLQLGTIADRAFYLGGGYKYAMGGEGCCFLHCPPGYALRPRDTGWFAAFSALESAQEGVGYGDGGARFLGATFDPVGLYRQRAVFAWLEELGIDAAAIREHVLALQARFLDGLDSLRQPRLSSQRLLVPTAARRGNFLAFETAEALALVNALGERGVIADARSDRLRFGFGLYHQPDDIDRLLERLATVLAGSA